MRLITPTRTPGREESLSWPLLVQVPYEVTWKALEERAFPGVEETFVHPFDDHNFIAGHATTGLEILEGAPDTHAVIAAIGDGGLISWPSSPAATSI